MSSSDWNETEGAILAAHLELVAAGLIEPVNRDGADDRQWMDCDLGSLAENRLGDVVDPSLLTEERRAHWLKHAAIYPETSPPSRHPYDRCYWLLSDGERVGTVAIGCDTHGGVLVHLSSLYVRPPHRGKRLGRRALERLRVALAKRGLGVKLATNWSWQPAVRLYLRMGLWLRSWKRDLQFCWPPTGTPDPIVEVGDTTASLSVDLGGDRMVLVTASREGERLALADHGSSDESYAAVGEGCYMASSTLALALAFEGWPLVRSAEHWQREHWADAGPPEALADRIVTWEAWDRHHGWRVDTPRIPGLDYATWEELQARWEAEAASQP